MGKNKKPKYVLSDMLPKNLQGARMVTPGELLKITIQLIQRLDTTTAYLMDMANALSGYDDIVNVPLDKKRLQAYIDENLNVLEPLKKKERKQ